jgi:hypothetical protein
LKKKNTAMGKKNLIEDEKISQETKDFIKKLSIKNFVLKSKIENLEVENKKEISEIVSDLKSMDKDVLSFFNVKLSEKEKEKALQYYNLLK